MDRLDHETCYQAVRRRDPRFDGRFYTAVVTTGIFCRPSCPAPTPKAVNIRFYPHAAAASEAGFRPCRRCRPELAPGHPEWNRRADLTGKALRLIEAGAVERVGVAGLASELGVSERHLRRELQATVGTGPLQLARTRRLWLARLLLDQTNLPVTDVAFASGFGSVRQFNTSIRRAFDAPPSALRHRGATRSPATTITLQLPCRGPVGWEQLHSFLATRAIPGLESAGDGTFRRNMGAGWIELGTGQGRGGPEAGRRSASRAPDTLTVTCSLQRLSDLTGLLPTIRFVADLDTDLDAVGRHLGRDGALACRLRVHGPSRLPGTFDRFELAVRAVVGQQVSVKAARTLLGRLVELAGTSPGGFPTPDALASGDVVAQLGMPQRRRATIAALARAFADERVVLAPHTDPAAARRQLLAITGIGPWTAGYITMRALGDPDGWPVGDLGLRRSLDVTAGELETRAERWRPWRAYAAMLLWRSDPTIERAGGPSPARRPRRPPPASAQTPAPAPTSTEGVTT